MKISSPPTDLKHERSAPIIASRKVELKSYPTVENRLPFGQQVGPLKIGQNKPIGKERKIYAQCDCGTGRWYTPDTLRLMIEDRLGCGEPHCHVISLKDKLWRDKDESLRLQLFLLLVTQPEEVQSCWGGSFDDMSDVFDFEEAYDNLTEYLTGEGQWFKRRDEEMPFIEGNVTFSHVPDGMLAKVTSGNVWVGDVSLSFRELSRKTGLKAPDLLLKLYKLRGSEDILLTLLED